MLLRAAYTFPRALFVEERTEHAILWRIRGPDGGDKRRQLGRVDGKGRQQQCGSKRKVRIS